MTELELQKTLTEQNSCLVTYSSVVVDEAVRFAEAALVESIVIDAGAQEHGEQHGYGSGHCCSMDRVLAADCNLD